MAIYHLTNQLYSMMVFGPDLKDQKVDLELNADQLAVYELIAGPYMNLKIDGEDAAFIYLSPLIYSDPEKPAAVLMIGLEGSDLKHPVRAD